MKPRIYCWVNSGHGTDMQVVVALAEDGTCLASHMSSSEGWARHDIGVTSGWKHEHYSEHYPDGFEMVWVSDFHQHQRDDQGFALALVRNEASAEAEQRGGVRK